MSFREIYYIKAVKRCNIPLHHVNILIKIAETGT